MSRRSDADAIALIEPPNGLSNYDEEDPSAHVTIGPPAPRRTLLQAARKHCKYLAPLLALAVVLATAAAVWRPRAASSAGAAGQAIALHAERSLPEAPIPWVAEPTPTTAATAATTAATTASVAPTALTSSSTTSSSTSNSTTTSSSTTISTSTTTRTADARLAAAFPEMEVIVVPEIQSDVDRLVKFRREADLYIPGGMLNVRVFDGIYPDLWPKGGRYVEAETCLSALKPNPALGAQEAPYWYRAEQREFVFGAINPTTGAALHPDFNHHTGCALSHFCVWMHGHARGVKHLFITESDHGPVEFSGHPADLAEVVIRAVWHDAPPTWDLMHLDHHLAGAEGGPVVTMTSANWTRPYSLYRWVGKGVAGLSMYIVSDRFLSRINSVVEKEGMVMVDAWIGGMCHDGVFECYSLTETM